jgi:hypothetical protein
MESLLRHFSENDTAVKQKISADATKLSAELLRNFIAGIGMDPL